ncbi:MAG: TdeIII family type II restriction endonuclease [candidate division Zixibacteria bacterium HGW-Zixibacteria-1]|nr:MAG: TdeIII family type II restriction endonuclease [candidate division Zixibacteria bacterium HGW-Zixibacteria-1]
MAAFTDKARQEIIEVIEAFMTRILDRRISGEPFDETIETQKRPFHYALVPIEIWKSAKLERSFVTVMGQIGFEHIAKIIALDGNNHAENGFLKKGVIRKNQLDTIHDILYQLERSKETGRKPNLEAELKSLDALKNSGEEVEIEVMVDLYIKRKTSKEELFIEIKSSMPNADQTKVSKEKLYKIYCMDSQNKIYFALPDNPYLKKENYAWSHPKRYFDMKNDKIVVMGETFWNEIIGNSPKTWDYLIALFREVGGKYRDRIKSEYLGLR